MKTRQQKRSNSRPALSTRSVENPLIGAFAARLKAWRQKEGRSLKSIAREIGVSISIICEWEHAHRFPTVDNLWAVVKLTGIPPQDLLRPVKGGGKARRGG